MGLIARGEREHLEVSKNFSDYMGVYILKSIELKMGGFNGVPCLIANEKKKSSLLAFKSDEQVAGPLHPYLICK